VRRAEIRAVSEPTGSAKFSLSRLLQASCMLVVA